jgi:hypothetical protein
MVRFLRLLLAPFLIVALGGAQPVAITRSFSLPANDPYSLAVVAPFVSANPNVNFFADWNNPNGKEVVDATALTGTTRVIVVTGQSNTTNVVPALYVPANRLGVINFNIGDGGFYRAKSGGSIDPLLGCTGFAPNLPATSPWPNGNWIGQLADQLITAGKATNVIVVPIGVGGSFIADWAAGGSNNPRIAVAFRRMQRAGLVPDVIISGQGESDHGATSQAAYMASANSMIATFRSFWPTVPIFINVESWAGGSVDPNIANAQAAIVNHSTGIWAGANADALTGNSCGAGGASACRQSDGLHWSTAGAFSIATAVRAALAASGF